MATDPSKTTEVHIALPLSIDVAASMMLAISQMYPSSRVSTENGRVGHMTFLIDNHEREGESMEPLSEAELLAAKVYKDPAVESATLDSVESEDGSLGFSFGVPDNVTQLVAQFCTQLLSIPLAKNYVELKVRDASGQEYFLIACRSEKQSPYELHQAGVAQLATIKSELLALGQETFKGSPALMELLNS